MILIDGCEPTLTGLKEKATDLALVGSESSKAAIGHSVSSLCQRWTRLRSVARAQEKALEDTARDWRSFREKVGYLSISTYSMYILAWENVVIVGSQM